MYLKRSIRTALPVAVALLIVLGGPFVGFGAGASPASASTVDDEQVFVQLINQLRADEGLAPLTVDAELRSSARSWTASMASNDALAHSPDMTVGITAAWTVLGENVGVHGVHDVEQLFQAFVDSPSHYRNLTDPRFQFVGVGVTHASNGKIWTTHKFMAASLPVSPPGTTPPQTAPPETTQPQTAPPQTAPPQTVAPQPVSPATAPPQAAPPTTASPATPTPKTEPNDGERSETESAPTDPPTTLAPTTKPSTANPSKPSTTGPSTPATEAPSASTSPDVEGDGDSDQLTFDSSTSSEDMAELVKPDVETIETVLIDLMLAGV